MSHLKVTKKILYTLGLYDYDDTIYLFVFIKYFVLLFFLLITFITSCWYVTKNLDDLEKVSNGLFAANIMFISSIYLTMLYMQKKDVHSTIDLFETIINERMYKDLISIFDNFFCN